MTQTSAAFMLTVLLALPVSASAQPPRTPPIVQAADQGRADRVESLLAKGSDPNARDARGDTALMRAASRGHFEIVRKLMIGGAARDLKNDAGETAFDRAVQHQHADIIALLRDAS